MVVRPRTPKAASDNPEKWYPDRNWQGVSWPRRKAPASRAEQSWRSGHAAGGSVGASRDGDAGEGDGHDADRDVERVLVVVDGGVGGKVSAGEFVARPDPSGWSGRPAMPTVGPLRRVPVTDTPSADPVAGGFWYQAWRPLFRCGRSPAVKVRSRLGAGFPTALLALTGFGTKYLVRGPNRYSRNRGMRAAEGRLKLISHSVDSRREDLEGRAGGGGNLRRGR
jgi:hypothetical protein